MSKDIFEKEEEKNIIDVPKEERYLNTSSYDYSVDFLVSMMKGDFPKIILEVPFQRQYVWKDDKASQLIESIIMNVPIPPLYFAEEEDGRWLVIDGLQRLNALLRFYQNEFSLKKLEILTEMERMKFKDMHPKAKSLLNNGLIRANVIRKDSHPDIKYDIFMRLNKGAVTLNYQELRNCLFRGRLNDLAKNLVKENAQFLQILNLKEPHNRFLDVEFIVRFFAFYYNLKKGNDGFYYIQDYKGRMVEYLNNFMAYTRSFSINEVNELRDVFNNTISKVVEVFGVENAFRDISSSKSKVNRALADSILLGFTRFNKEVLIYRKEEINDLLMSMLQENVDFKNSISFKTSDKDILNYRINEWIKSLEHALDF